jgi:hypothetical protein
MFCVGAIVGLFLAVLVIVLALAWCSRDFEDWFF